MLFTRQEYFTPGIKIEQHAVFNLDKEVYEWGGPKISFEDGWLYAADVLTEPLALLKKWAGDEGKTFVVGGLDNEASN